MNAQAIHFLKIFSDKLVLEVPIFQRQYVWDLEEQWEPLWEDISRKFNERLDTTLDRKDAPAHFLGAMVFDSIQTPTTHVHKRQVIDGQQRLITFQIFLSAIRDFCKEQECKDLSDECNSFILNKGLLTDPSVDKFKVYPTKLDRKQFEEIVVTESHKMLEQKHPQMPSKKKKDEPRLRMVEAYFFFYDKISEYFLGDNSEKPLAEDSTLVDRLDQCLQVLKNDLQVVVIDLSPDDDPQIIFETLNARGEPLLPADLLRNFIFLRAARNNEPQVELYEQYWKKFDDEFWRQEIKQGRMNRPRSDLFMQHFLTSRQLTDIPVKHLFAEYKFWIKKTNPFPTVRDELVVLASQRDEFRRIIEPKNDDPLFPLPNFLKTFEISPAYPLLLFLLDTRLSDDNLKEISIILESYILRRAVCQFTTKNYNRTFLNLTRSLHQNGVTPKNISDYLSKLQGESAEWPTDDTFFNAWQHNHVYKILKHDRMEYILRRLDDSYRSNKTEHINIVGPLTIEHIMPQTWLQNWLLSDGSKGLTSQEILDSNNDDLRVKSTNQRNSSLQTLGNLTILTQSLNSSISNSPWSIKKPQLLQFSSLPINQQLFSIEIWDEESIENRGKKLFERAKIIWPAPSVVDAH